MSTAISTAEATRCYEAAKLPLQGDLTRDKLLWTLRRNQDIRISCYHRNSEIAHEVIEPSDQYKERTSDELREALRYARSTSDFRELGKSATTLDDRKGFLHEVYDATYDVHHKSFYGIQLVIGVAITLILTTILTMEGSGKKALATLGIGAVLTGVAMVIGYQIHLQQISRSIQESE